MDTKWNNTTETVEIEPVMPQRKGTGLRAAAAFLTFFLGVSLTLGSLCGAVGRRAIGSDYAEWWQNDWQETPVFRNRISNDLESFLAIGVGRTVDCIIRIILLRIPHPEQVRSGSLRIHQWQAMKHHPLKRRTRPRIPRTSTI